MDAAQAADRALATGEPIGPLHGVPVTIKDHGPCAACRRRTARYLRAARRRGRQRRWSPACARAGAIILGKTTTPEFGWTGVSNSPLTGITHNPWKYGYERRRLVGRRRRRARRRAIGPLHQGSDGAGSIRMPAHFCGVFGLKPTFGRVP